MKNLTAIFKVNCMGFVLVALSFCGYRGFVAHPAPFESASIAIDVAKLKARLAQCSKCELEKMLAAGEEVEKWSALLSRTGANVVQEVLKGQGTFQTMEHYPLSDSFDANTHSQYFYHTHREGEHGHFHLFLRREGMDGQIAPLVPDDPPATFAHLIAISMDSKGAPLSLFTVNRWVTGEDWYSGNDLKRMLDCFRMTHAYPSYVTNQWLNAMVVLFRPQIEDLLEKRDAAIRDYQNGIPLEKILEREEFDALSEEKISVQSQIEVLRELLS